MFGKLRQMVDEVLDRLEENQGGVTEDDIDRVIRAMRTELVETKARTQEAEAALRTQLSQADTEREAARTAERRAEQAKVAGDEETVEVATRFARRHRQRLDVLVAKAEATQAELLQLRDETAQGREQLKSAMARRDSLAVQQRRAQAIGRSASRFDSVDAFDRMASKMEGATDLRDAEREVEEALHPTADTPGPDPADELEDAAERAYAERDYAAERELREAQADAMLAELKRRMAQGK